MEIARKNCKEKKELRQRRQIVEYDILRVIVCLLVIVDHCSYYAKVTPYGGRDFSLLGQSSPSLFLKLAGYVSAVLGAFHMPLYMALSGALMKVKEKSAGGGYKSYRDLIKDKAPKLLVPFFLVSIFYSVPLKFLSGYYRTSKHIFSDILIGQVFIQGNTHLWFLPTLFLASIILFAVAKHFHSNIKVGMIYLFFLSFTSALIPINIVRNSLYYAFWLLVGYVFEDERMKIQSAIKDRPMHGIVWIGIFLAVTFLAKAMPEEYALGLAKRLFNYGSAFLGCFGVFYLSCLVSRTRISETNVFRVVRKNTLGLYLYSDPLNYILLALAVNLFGQTVFMENVASAGLYFSRMLFTFSAALTISCVLQKLDIKYLC